MNVPSHKSHSNMLLSHLNECKHFIYMRELIGCDINTFLQFTFANGRGWSQNSTVYETGIEKLLYSPEWQQRIKDSEDLLQTHFSCSWMKPWVGISFYIQERENPPVTVGNKMSCPQELARRSFHWPTQEQFEHQDT